MTIKSRLCLSILASISLAGCIEEGTPSPKAAPDLVGNANGWSINPKGDLNAFFDCLEAKDTTLVSAHRGGPMAGFPENAVETMAEVLTKAPAIFEVDVATSSDGVLYLMHDDTLERTTTGSGTADGKTWREIAALSLVDNNGDRTGFAPSTLDQALDFVDGRAILQIDFKQSTRYEDVTDVVRKKALEDRVIYIAYSMASARKLHRLAPKSMISLSVQSQSDLNRAVAAGIPADRLLGFTGTEGPRARLFNLLNDQDVEVIFGTLGGRRSIDRDIANSGDNDRYNDIAEMGVDILATDRPIAAHQALESSGNAAQSGTCGISRS